MKKLILTLLLLITPITSFAWNFELPINWKIKIFGPISCSKALNTSTTKTNSIDPWLRKLSPDVKEMSLNDIELLLSNDGKVPAMSEFYYIVSSFAGKNNISFRRKLISDLISDDSHEESIQVINGKLVLVDNWFFHNNGSGAIDQNPLVSTETFNKYKRILENKRNDTISFLSHYLNTDMLELSLSPNFEADISQTNTFTLKQGVELNAMGFLDGKPFKLKSPEYSSNENTWHDHDTWTLSVGNNQKIYINDGWGDTIALLNKSKLIK
jgi:hypothetical protein